MKLAGVVVWYNPSKKDIKNIDSYIKAVDKLYIVDNSENGSNESKIPNSKKVEYIYQNENLGIAKALNIACYKAIKEKYKFILTMDQDSCFKSNDVDKMKTKISSLDLSKIGTFLLMILIGVIICTIVNIFLQNSTFDLILSIICIVAFLGFVAYDVQKIKHLNGFMLEDNLAVMGAFELYLDFINIFIDLLRIFGNSDD